MSEQATVGPRVTLEGVQVVRGVAALLVLFFHTTGKLIVDYQSDLPIFSLTGEFGFAGVDLFFVLSGFIIVWITWPDIGHPSKAPHFLLRRFLRVAPIFWIVWLASGAMYFMLGSQFFRCRPDVSIFQQTLDALFLLAPSKHCIVPQAWTLTWELMFYLVFAVFLCLPRVLLPFLLAAWAGVIAAAIAFGFDSIMPLQAFCLHFILGCFVGLLTRVGPIPMPWITALVGVAMWIAASWYQIAGGAVDNSPLLRFLVFGIPSAVLLYGVASLDVRNSARYAAPLKLLGDASYVLYLTHVTVLYYLQASFPRLAPEWGAWAWTGGAIASSILVAIVVHLFVERPMLKALGRPKNLAFVLVGAVVAIGALIGLAFYLQTNFAKPAPVAPAPAPIASVEPVPAEVETPIPPLESITVLPGVQGWAPIIVKNSVYEVPGWAIDRERDTTALKVLLFIDGALVEEQVPTYPRPDVAVTKTIGNRQPGFFFTLDAAKVDAAKCVRFVAVLEDGRFGHVGLQIRGKGDETKLCWNPIEDPA